MAQLSRISQAGAVTRARLATYQALADYRRERNGERKAEPTALEQVPD